MTASATEKAIRYLTQSPLLNGVSEEVLRAIEPPPEIISLRAGETLIKEGELSTDYFVLISGRLRAFKQNEDRLIPIGTVFPGEGVGEMSLFTEEPRFATVVARLDSELVRFPQSTFLVLANLSPLAMLNIVRTVIRRATQGSPVSRVAEFPSIAILPLTGDVDARQIARDLARELETLGSVCQVGSQFTGSLDELEHQCDFLVYAADAEATDWSRVCMLRADLVLLAVSVTASSRLHDFEGLIQKTDRQILGRVDVLFIHPKEWKQHCGAVHWLERLSPKEHHHVRSGNRPDTARLARIVAGRANNLVLSGGGARGFAHIGALRAFRECQIPIDRIGGASMGAGVGALVGLGDQFESLSQEFRKLFLRRRPGRDFTLPFLSILAGKKMASIGMDLYGEWRIEDLPIRYFCVSSDLGEGELIEHFDGLLWVALRSTAAMPVIAPPLAKGGRLLIDGGVLNNLPIDVMRAHFSGKVFAVDVSTYDALLVGKRWDLLCPSGFEILFDKLNPFTPKADLPNIFEILHRTATLSSGRQARQARAQADVLITPPVERFSVADFNSFDEIVEMGYRGTLEVLEALDKRK